MVCWARAVARDPGGRVDGARSKGYVGRPVCFIVRFSLCCSFVRIDLQRG